MCAVCPQVSRDYFTYHRAAHGYGLGTDGIHLKPSKSKFKVKRGKRHKPSPGTDRVDVCYWQHDAGGWGAVESKHSGAWAGLEHGGAWAGLKHGGAWHGLVSSMNQHPCL